ncbi:conserved hypothetical protein [Klebsiella pneumoniae]|nr:hypothetical protein KP1_0186 [Klebsiella pneumoniae subsp. pneumoniae NTUH-K2044]SBN26453.1 conserved hypothetical protein [Klebsiella pneumoniae]
MQEGGNDAHPQELTEGSDWGKQGSQRICKSKYDEF